MAAPDIWQMLTGPWSDDSEEYRWNQLRAYFDFFTEGRLIHIGRSGYMRPLDKRREEVWEIRSPRPRPSLRVFGRFAERDVFVATNWAERKLLKGRGSREWRDEIELR